MRAISRLMARCALLQKFTILRRNARIRKCFHFTQQQQPQQQEINKNAIKKNIKKKREKIKQNAQISEYPGDFERRIYAVCEKNNYFRIRAL